MSDPSATLADEPRSKVDPINRDPEELVEVVLRACAVRGPPLLIKECVGHIRNLSVFEDALTKDGYLLDFQDGFAEILLNSQVPRERARYTAAHEIGHWILKLRSPHREIHHQELEQRRDRIERWCEEFAAALLMPSRWVRDFVGPRSGLKQDRVIVYGPNVFFVSRDAFYARLRELYGIAIAHCVREGLDASTRVWPDGVNTGLDLDAVDDFLRNTFWSRLRGRDEPLTTAGFTTLPGSGVAVLVTGGREPSRNDYLSLNPDNW